MNVRSTLLPDPEVILPLEWNSLQPARYCNGIGIRQNVAFSLPRLRLVLLDYEHESRENHGPKNAGCKPSSITIETSDYVACHWNPSLRSDLLAFWTWFLHSGYTLNKWVGANTRKHFAHSVGSN